MTQRFFNHAFSSGENAFAQADNELVDAILARRVTACRSIVVGLCGPQGSGKSTTAGRLAERLRNVGIKVVVMSLDDFYLTLADRRRVAEDAHPLFRTRGVPGTHDIALLNRTLDSLLAGVTDVSIPHFDKTIDDRADKADWPNYEPSTDVVLLEGWCVGARPMPDDQMQHPINQLEREMDPDGKWRRQINAALRGPYSDLFARLDLTVLLRAPSFEQVPLWRLEQELGLLRAPIAAPAMGLPEIHQFIAHFERVTRWILQDESAEIVIDIDRDRAPIGLRRKFFAGAAVSDSDA